MPRISLAYAADYLAIPLFPCETSEGQCSPTYRVPLLVLKSSSDRKFLRFFFLVKNKKCIFALKYIESPLTEENYMKYFATFIAIFLSLFAPLNTRANALSQYNIGYLNMNDGLPSNYVDDIYRDSKGFTWISTHGSGLVRYDGYSFYYLGMCGNLGFGYISNNCRNVVEDKYNRLWIAYEEGVKLLSLHTQLMESPKAVNNALQVKCGQHQLSHYLGRIYPLAADGREGLGHRRRFGHDTHRPADQAV